MGRLEQPDTVNDSRAWAWSGRCDDLPGPVNDSRSLAGSPIQKM